MVKREPISFKDLQPRGTFEKWLNKYNHIMEFFRTMFIIIMIVLQLYIISQLL